MIVLGQVDVDEFKNAVRVTIVIDDQTKIDVDIYDCQSDDEIFSKIKKVVSEFRSRALISILSLEGQDITKQVDNAV